MQLISNFYYLKILKILLKKPFGSHILSVLSKLAETNLLKHFDIG